MTRLRTLTCWIQGYLLHCINGYKQIRIKFPFLCKFSHPHCKRWIWYRIPVLLAPSEMRRKRWIRSNATAPSLINDRFNLIDGYVPMFAYFSFELNFNLLTFWTCLRLWRNRVRWIRIRLLVSPQCCMMRKAHISLQDWPEIAVGRYLCLDSRFDVHITDLYLVMVRSAPFWMKGIVSIGVKISVSSMWQGIVTYLDRKYSQHRDFDFPQSGRKASGVKQPIFPLNGSTAGFEICVQATVPWYPTPVW